MPKKQQPVSAALTAKDVIADHIYRGPHKQVSDQRVISVGKGVDHQGKPHKVCVVIEATEEPNRQLVLSMAEFLGWAVKDVTAGYKKIPKVKAGKRKTDGDTHK